MWSRRLFLFLFLCIGLCRVGFVCANSVPSVAFFYGRDLPLDELHLFDVVVVHPVASISPKKYNSKDSKMYAYVSLGEWDGGLKIPNKKWVKARNSIWKSDALDQTNVQWRHYLLDKIVAPLVKQGYQGVFFDTIDSYQLFAKTAAQRAAQEAGIVATIKAVKARFPRFHIILNRGFEILPRVAKYIDGVAVESLYQGWDQARQRYTEVSASDRSWVRAQMQQVKKLGLWPIVIDYVNPADRKKIQATAKKIQHDGYIPWVTDGLLTSLGVSSVRVVPRTVFVVYDSKQFPEITESSPMRFMAFPLEQMGYIPRLLDVRKPLPAYPLPGRVAAVAVWVNGEIGKRTAVLDRWLKQQLDNKIPIALLGSFAYLEASPSLSKQMHLKFNATEAKSPIKVVKQSDLFNFETKPYPGESVMDVMATQGSPQITIADSQGMRSTPVAYMSWGGFAQAPYIVHALGETKTLWVLRPFQFFKRSLKLKTIPVPDLTTKNGLRMLMAHVDGDGWVTKSEWFKGPIAAKSMLDKVLMKYRIPSTISVIEGELSTEGPYPTFSKQAMQVARDIYKLPWVEVATHTFSHPFKWRALEKYKAGAGYNLPIKGYRYSAEREITGSMNFIDNNLVPKGKRCKVILWSGDTNPDEKALAVAYHDHLLNMNGGDTLITERNNTLTAIAPIGIIKGKYIQIYAPNQNENVYTNGWTGPYYGYRDAIETFQLTESPHRYKPIDIYYHTYSASKKASLRALDQVYQWALAQKTNKIYSSEYIKRAMSFYHAVIGVNENGWIIKNQGDLTEYRVPDSWGHPRPNNHVMGYNGYDHQYYIHTDAASDAQFDFTKKASSAAFIESVNGSVFDFSRKNNSMMFSLKSFEPLQLVIHGGGECQLQQSGRVIPPVKVTKRGEYSYTFDKEVVNALTAKCAA